MIARRQRGAGSVLFGALAVLGTSCATPLTGDGLRLLVDDAVEQLLPQLLERPRDARDGPLGVSAVAFVHSEGAVGRSVARAFEVSLAAELRMPRRRRRVRYVSLPWPPAVETPALRFDAILDPERRRDLARRACEAGRCVDYFVRAVLERAPHAWVLRLDALSVSGRDRVQVVVHHRH